MRYQKEYFVYIMASKSGVLYIGVTNNIYRRVLEHKIGLIDSFTKKYKCGRLVYYENGNNIYVMIEREKQIKHWRREKKINLINISNPQWKDLSEDWYN